jgi:hypothetical protein
MILAQRRQRQVQNHEHIYSAWMQYPGISSTHAQDRQRVTYLARPLVATAAQSRPLVGHQHIHRLPPRRMVASQSSRIARARPTLLPRL